MTVEVLTLDEVCVRRAAVLRSAGVSEADLRNRGRRYMLTARELAALTELDGLDYLRFGPGPERVRNGPPGSGEAYKRCPAVARDQVAAMREIERRRAGGAS